MESGHEEQREDEMLGDDTGSTQSWAVAIKWFEACGSHKRCKRPENYELNYLPRRVIDVGSEADSQLRLFVPSAPRKGEKYVTLSHCWGKENVSQLLSSNFSALLEEIPFESLSRTFQHAVIITRRLGVRYLWIDSLCIIQDSPNDWETQSSFMSRIYWSSFCNISATAAENGSQGLFFPHDVDALTPRYISLNIGQTSLTYRIYDDTIWDNGVINAPLNKRAWVCQERLLSPRNLHFGSNQLFWECGELSACEQFPQGDHQEDFHSALSTKQEFAVAIPDTKKEGSLLHILEMWNDIIILYTQGLLTFSTDKLVAISGVASIMSLTIGVRYLAGLWDTHLTKQLVWIVRGMGQSSSVYIAPSWSWASIDGPVWYLFAAGPEDDSDSQHIDVKEQETDLIEIIEATIKAATDNPFSQVASGHLTVRGKLVAGRLDHDPEDRGLMHLLTGDYGTSTDVGVIWDHRRHVEIVKRSENWHLLPILHYYLPGALEDSNALVRGIVLKPTGEVSGEFSGEYRRCGRFQFYVGETDCHRILDRAHAAFNNSGEGEKLDFTDDGNGCRDYTIVLI